MLLRPVINVAACLTLSAAFITGTCAANASEVTPAPQTGEPATAGGLRQPSKGFHATGPGKSVATLAEALKLGCTGAACPKARASLFGIHGSNIIGAQLMPYLIERFAEQEGYTIEKIIDADPETVQYKLYTDNGGVAGLISLQSHGSNTAPPDLQKGAAQAGMMSRPVEPEEVEAIEDRGAGLTSRVFALDGIAIMVSPQNPVKMLSLDEIAKIFAGAITDWSQVGGNLGKIRIYARDAKSGTYDIFNQLVLRPANLSLSPDALRFESSLKLSDETARDPNGIGFASLAGIRNAKPLTISTECGIVSRPQEFSVKTGEYPLSRGLFLLTAAPLPEFGAKLAAFTLSNNAQETISRAGFVSQNIELQSFDQQSGRLASALMVPDKDFNFAYMRELVKDLKNAQRLSITFRFAKSSATLDDMARANIPRLANFLKRNTGRFTDVVLAGFTDSTGTFDANRAKALARAMAFKHALVAEGVPEAQIAVKSYGSLLPVGCNTTEAGRDKNRRVEVWVKE